MVLMKRVVRYVRKVCHCIIVVCHAFLSLPNSWIDSFFGTDVPLIV